MKNFLGWELHPQATVWWAKPHLIAWFLLMPLLALSHMVSQTGFENFRQPIKYLNETSLFFGLAGLFLFGLGSYFIANKKTPTQPSQMLVSNVPVETYRFALKTIGIILTAAYVIFFIPLLTNLHLLISLFQGSSSAMFELRNTLNSIPGITSFTNLQGIFVVMALLYPAVSQQKMPNWLKIWIGVILFFCILRMFAWSERIAMLEILIPLAMSQFAFLPLDAKRAKLSQLFPIFGIVFLVLLFAVGEYFRSWQFYQWHWDSFNQFIGNRLMAYYATALNNGYGYWTELGTQYSLNTLLTWLYNFPGLSSFFEQEDSITTTRVFLENFLQPEFNNMSGIYMLMVDLGPVLGLGVWFILGAIAGLIYRKFTEKNIFALIFYPAFAIGMFEILRIFYWSNQRFFPVVLTLLMLMFFWRNTYKANNV